MAKAKGAMNTKGKGKKPTGTKVPGRTFKNVSKVLGKKKKG